MIGSLLDTEPTFHNALARLSRRAVPGDHLQVRRAANAVRCALDSGSLRFVNASSDLMVDGLGNFRHNRGPSWSWAMGQDEGRTGQTTNADRFDPPLLAAFEGRQAVAAQQLEVMSRDLGNTPAGFSHNFAYDTLQVGNPPNYGANVKWIRGQRPRLRARGRGQHADRRAVQHARPQRTARLRPGPQLAGTNSHGSVSIVPSGGPIPLSASAPAAISAAGHAR